jgi:hypothetical protein
MKRSLLLLFTTLSLVTGCGSDSSNDPQPVVATNAGKLTATAEGLTFTGTAESKYDPATATGTGVDLLSINTTTPNKEYFSVFYTKPAGAAESQYKLVGVRYDRTNTRSYYYQPTGTLSKSAAGWSGTFAAKLAANSTATDGTVSAGTFTDVK